MICSIIYISLVASGQIQRTTTWRFQAWGEQPYPTFARMLHWTTPLGVLGWPIFFCWSGLFLLSQCMVLQVPQFNVAITLSFQPVIFFWRNLWTASCSLRTRPYQKYGKGSQGAVCEGIQWKVSEWWWLLFLHKSGKWGPPKLVSVELWEEDGRRA